MKLHQLSLFLTNRAGTLKFPCKVLADAGINMLALTLADTKDFGILRMIVKDWAHAKKVLEDAGQVVKVTEVVALDVPHKPGGLAAVLDVLEQSKQGIEYLYAFGGGGPQTSAAMVFCFEDPDAAIAALELHGISAVAPATIFARMDA